eukprot:5914237-Prymnesium_polylepis.1
MHRDYLGGQEVQRHGSDICLPVRKGQSARRFVFGNWGGNLRTCGCPIWDLPSCPARYDAQFRGRSLGPGDFSLPLAGVMAHTRPAERPPPGGHSPASNAGNAPGGTQPGTEHGL